ncbi:uncharacterized protein FYW61_002751 [Anableps anableps]
MSFSLEKDLTCPVCHDVFKEPVFLQCSHSFCKGCLQGWWSEKQIKTCPLCKDISSSRQPPCNLVLKNLCEAFLLEKDQKTSPDSEDLCSLHSEKLKLFCVDHQRPVCLVCRDSKAHRNHSFRPIDETVQDLKHELQMSLKPVQKKLKMFKEAKESCDETGEHIKVQARRTEAQILDKFRQLHRFLQEEEEARITALREEEQQKTQLMRSKAKVLSCKIADLSQTLEVTEKVLRAKNTTFLKVYNDVVSNVQYRQLWYVPQPVPGALIDEAKHLENLVFNTWIKMKKMISFYPVILDPNTAHPELFLSDDLTSVAFGPRQKLPDNPERFDQNHCVLGSEGFDSGTHSWDVEVQNDQNWGVGVVKESIHRKGETQTGFWGIALIGGKYLAASRLTPDKVLGVKTLQRIRVQLSIDRGRSEKDLTCALCCDIFRDPVKLECSHSFCKDCLQADWAEKQTRLCPLCKQMSLLRNPPRNLMLKNLCFAFFLGRGQRSPTGSQDLCSLHSEKLKLFCLDHEEPVCLICRDSEAHNGHSFRPIRETVQDHRDELQNHLEPLKEKLNRFQQVQQSFDETAELIKVQAERTETQIKDQFKKLHQFLQEEEEARIRALREEEEQKSQVMKEKREDLSRNIEALSETVTATEEEFRRSEDGLLLQNFKTAKERVQQCPLLDDPQPLSGALIDEARHLGNLSYNIWTKMKHMVSFSPVILDPNTAEPHLTLSADLTGVTFGPRQKLPDNPERFEQRHCVISHEGFSSGTHSWDVEVRTEDFWGLGVLSESVPRKGQIQAGFWGICLCNGSYAAISYVVPSKALPVTKLQRIRVQLNWDEGEVSFFDLDADNHLHTFKHTFTEKLFAYICKMSSQSEKDLSCSICYDIFKDPVVLSCSHSFCRDCLQRWWSERRKDSCPLCKEISTFRSPPSNLALKNLCETFTLERKKKPLKAAENLCSLHAETLKLFCLDHQQPACLICRDSKAHSNHRFRPISEAAQDHREDLLGILKPLKKKLKLLKQVKGSCDETAEHIKIQVKYTERHIRSQFSRLRQLLEEEEDARINALREEEKRKCKEMRDRTEVLNRAIRVLSDAIRASEEELSAADLIFLQNYKDTSTRVKYCPLLDDPQPPSAALIDEAKHLGNLTYNIWTKLKKTVSYTPILLDPKTAHPELLVSADLTGVTFGPRQKLPENPERFDRHHCVLGCEGFTSGTHGWDVEVRHEQNWGVGVVKESVQRKGEIQDGFWGICLFNGRFTAVCHPFPSKNLPVKKLKRVRVQLDWDGGMLSFFDLDADKHIHTFIHRFTEKMFPFIGTNNKSPVRILPVMNW